MPSSPGRRGAATAAPRTDEKGKSKSKQSQRTAHGANYLKETAASSSRHSVRDSWRDSNPKKRVGSHENVSRDKKHHPDATIPPKVKVSDAEASNTNKNKPTPGANGDAARQPNLRESVVAANANDHSGNNVNPPNPEEETDMEVILNHGISIPDEDARHVYIRCKDQSDRLALKKLNSFDKGDEVSRIVEGEYEWHRSLPSGPILVVCKDATQVTKLLNVNTFLGVPVETEVAYNFNTVQGVISDPSICDMPMETIKEKLKSQHVVNVRPIYSGTDRTKTNYVAISFRLKKLPRRIFLGRERHNVSPYRVYANQCTNCWWFGHKAVKCTRPQVCKRCAKKGELDHNYESCTLVNGNFNCKNCNGNHTADDKDCPAWRKQSAVAKIRSNYQVSFKRAVDIYNKKNRQNANNNIGSSNNDNRNIANSINSGRQSGGRADSYIALTPKGPRGSSYSEAARAPPSGRYSVLQDMTVLDNAPEDNYFSPQPSTSRASNSNRRNRREASTRPRTHNVPASAQYSSSEEELVDYLGMRKGNSKMSKGARARPPREEAERTAFVWKGAKPPMSRYHSVIKIR